MSKYGNPKRLDILGLMPRREALKTIANKTAEIKGFEQPVLSWLFEAISPSAWPRLESTYGVLMGMPGGMKLDLVRSLRSSLSDCP